MYVILPEAFGDGSRFGTNRLLGFPSAIFGEVALVDDGPRSANSRHRRLRAALHHGPRSVWLGFVRRAIQLLTAIGPELSGATGKGNQKHDLLLSGG
jgi:hypothetical protein